MLEPILHSQITDGLPEDDPRAWQTIRCVHCQIVVHTIPNECMVEWFDTGIGPLCWDSFLELYSDPDQNEERLGLPDDA